MNALLEPIIDSTIHVLRFGGVWAVFGLMFLESCCIPAPSEVIMLFAGYLVWMQDATMLQVVFAGVAGNVLGSIACWLIGAYGGRAVIDSWGRYIRLNHHHVELAERFFNNRGSATVLIARMLPIVRTFISLPAGIAKMPLSRFTILTTIGCIPWVWGLTHIGVRLGPNWQTAREKLHHFDELVLLILVLSVLFFIIKSRLRKKEA